RFRKLSRTQHKGHPLCWNIFHVPAKSTGNVQSTIRSVQLKFFLISSIIDYYIKTPRHRYDEFLLLFKRMAPANLSSGHIRNPVYSLDGKRYMVTPFDKGEVSPGVFNFG